MVNSGMQLNHMLSTVGHFTENGRKQGVFGFVLSQQHPPVVQPGSSFKLQQLNRSESSEGHMLGVPEKHLVGNVE